MTDPSKRGTMGWIAVAAILAASILTAWLVALDQRQDHRDRHQSEAERVSQVLNAASQLTVGQLDALARLSASEPGGVPHDFRAIVDPMQEAHVAGAFAFLRGLERHVAGAPGIRAPDGRHFVPVQASGADQLRELRPADRGTAQHFTEVLDSSLAASSAAATRASRIAGTEGLHVLVARPVPTGERGRETPQSRPGHTQAADFVAAAIPLQALVDAARLLAPEGTSVVFVGEDGSILPNGALTGDEHGASTLSIADRTWEVRLAAPGAASILVPLLIGAGGLLIAIIMAVLLKTWSRRERAALELARQRVAERDRAMQAEAATNRMYRLLAENLTDAVIVVDTEGRITYASPACESMLGWDPEDLRGRSLAELIHPEDLEHEREVMSELVAGPAVETFEHRLLHASGDHVWVESAVRSVEDPETGEITELQSTSRDISERKPFQEQLERLAREDPLTGLANRRGFREALEAEASRSRRSGAELSIAMIDIDYFKEVNDSFGHLVGDRVIQLVARVIRRRLRSTDTLARLGGDEFALVLPETSEGEAMVVATWIMDEMRGGRVDRELPEVTVSIGVAGPEASSGVDAEAILERADRALYEAKHAGRNEIRAAQATGGTGAPS